MKHTYSWYHQQRKQGLFATPTVSFAEPTRPFTPTSPTPSHEKQEQPGPVAQFSHSLDHISILPPGPERDTRYEVEPPGMQQIGAESSPTLPRERPERPERITQFKHSLERFSIRPPTPERDTGYQREPSAMQQTGTESSSVQREETGEQVESQEGEALQKVAAPSQVQENRTGLPDTLKVGVESLSGLSLDDVRVHYHSAKPAQVDALAYTQGTEIHVGPGQERHLAHEAWHVVQQMQGRVRPSLQMRGVKINDDQGLEREADVMGEKAEAFSFSGGEKGASISTLSASLSRENTVQRAILRIQDRGITPNMRQRWMEAAGTFESQILSHLWLAGTQLDQVVLWGVSQRSSGMQDYGQTAFYIATDNYTGCLAGDHAHFELFWDYDLDNIENFGTIEVTETVDDIDIEGIYDMEEVENTHTEVLPARRIVVTVNLTRNPTVKDIYATLLHEWNLHGANWLGVMYDIINRNIEEVREVQNLGHEERERNEHWSFAEMTEDQIRGYVSELGLDHEQEEEVFQEMLEDRERIRDLVGYYQQEEQEEEYGEYGEYE